MDQTQIEEIPEDKPPGTNSQLFIPEVTEGLLFPKDIIYKKNFRHDLFEYTTLEIVSDLHACQSLWEMFNPKNSVFDTWEFRYAFYCGYHHRPYFIVIRQFDDVIGLLPLWYEADKKQYCWFGSNWQEDNRFFVKDERLIPILLAAAPKPLYLDAILPEYLPAKYLHMFEADEPKFILDLTNFNSLDDYLSGLNKKKRYNIRRDVRLIEQLEPNIIYDRFEDFDSLVKLSTHRFHEKGDEADWVDPKRVEVFRRVIELGQSKRTYVPRMITVEIGGEIASVDLILLHGNSYQAVKCAYNVTRFPGIGSFVNTLEISDAICLGLTKMDFLQINYGWKDSWFTPKELCKFEKQ